MKRTRLEAYNIAELQAEAAKYNLPTSSDRTKLLDAILTYLERNGPIANPVGATGSGRRVELIQVSDPKELPSASAKGMQQVMKAVTEGVKSQQQQLLQLQLQCQEQNERSRLQQQLMQQQYQLFLQQQQQQFDRLIQVLSARNDVPVRTEPTGPNEMNVDQPRAPVNLPSDQLRLETLAEQSRRDESSRWSVPISSLASQLPEYGGKDEENIRAWTQRADHVARVHGASDGAILLAATSRLTGAARRWYDT